MHLPYLHGGTALEGLVELGAAGPVDLGALTLPAPARVALVAAGAARRWESFRVTRELAGDERVVVFDGRVETPAEFTFSPGLYEVTFGAGAPSRLVLPPGGNARLTAPAR